MIRELQVSDINKVANIWLDAELKAHYFIPLKYWKRNYELVKEMPLQAEVYVYENGQKIQGFAVSPLLFIFNTSLHQVY